MIAYLAKRLSRLARSSSLGVTIVTFCLTFIIPADPVAMIAGRNSTAEMREQIRKQLGLDRPLIEQYASYVDAPGARRFRHLLCAEKRCRRSHRVAAAGDPAADARAPSSPNS